MLRRTTQPSEETVMSETMVPTSDTWRRDINQAVRDFASSGATSDDTVRMFLTTMLREVGEALALDCSALIEIGDGGPIAAPVYSWCRTAREGDRPFESREGAVFVRALLLESDAVVIRADSDATDEPGFADVAAYLREAGVGVALFVPIVAGHRLTAVWVFGAFSGAFEFSDTVVEHLQTVGALVWSALVASRREPAATTSASAADAAQKIAQMPLRGRPAPPVRSVFPTTLGFSEIVGESAALHSALAALEEVVEADSSVLLLGETGTGKELFARALHARGPRRAFPLVSVNCAALPPTLIESELFGHQRGAFTGAIAPRQGRFELAHRGTLFLDEIGDLPLELQAKLLRVLQEGAFERVGSSQSQAVDVRIIGATHHDLARAVTEGRFRADLYYRLNVFPIRLPPLRERREDIPALVWSIIRKRQQTLRRHITTVTDETMTILQQHSWPGNVRELENVIERALIHSPGDTLMLLDHNLDTHSVESPACSLVSVERAHIEGVLRECGWRINGFGNAAERLGLHPNTLRFRMKKLGIVRREPARESGRLRPPRAWAG
jgi:transcriptional regulator with GAF, ATPase, and Fis domain